MERTVIWLHAMEGWSHPELGRRFDRSESWSKSIVSRGLSRLRLELDEPLNEPHSHDDPPRPVARPSPAAARRPAPPPPVAARHRPAQPHEPAANRHPPPDTTE